VRQTSESEPVRVGLIGCGRWAREAYLPALTRLRGTIDVVAVATAHPMTARLAGAALGTRSFVGHEAILALDGVEAVINLTAHDPAAITLAALRAGKHVCTELDVGRLAAEIAAEAERQGRIVQFCTWPHVYRPIHVALGSALAAWRQRHPGPRAVSVTWGWPAEQVWHPLEGLCGPIARVCAAATPPGHPQVALVEFAHGDAGAVVSGGPLAPAMRRRIRFEFSHPSGLLTRTDDRLDFHGEQADELLPGGGQEFPFYDWHEDYVTMLADFARCVRGRTPPRMGIDTYLRSQRLEAALHASRHAGGEWIPTLDPPSPDP